MIAVQGGKFRILRHLPEGGREGGKSSEPKSGAKQGESCK